MINWQRVCLNLRQARGALAPLARELGTDPQTLNRLARGDVHQPRWDLGVALLDAHEKVCRQWHTLEHIGQ